VAINTAAIPKDLLESELFGHERGAFTGAQTMRRGRFEQAEGGTLFLDEIGDMPFELQTRLLRVLSDGQFYRVGGHSAVKSQVRVIAATHQNLEQRVREGAFREDLLHRLNVIRLRLPPLRERREDVPLLTRFFLQQSAKQLGVDPKRISTPALNALAAFDFPGNVRQLENICHWLTVMAPAQVVERKDLPPEVLQALAASGAGALAASSPAALASASAAVGAGAGVAGVGDGVGAAGAADGAGSAGGAGAALAASGTGWVGAPQDSASPGNASQSSAPPASADGAAWEAGLYAQAQALLAAGHDGVWDELLHRFEARLLEAALAHTQGRRIEAAQQLGIGRNTLTRKLHELGLG
jgi:two-component system nitrogen regulation response regulator GlnG